MQTLSILLTAAVLGSKMGLYTVLLFLLEGAMGIPVFSGFCSGITRLFGPTGGYLLGFVPAVFFVGKLLEMSRNRGFTRVFLIGCVGEVIIMVCGYLQLANFVGYHGALTLGVVPFLFTDLLKLIMFTLLAYRSAE
jgi:biotin transport system substrate-specific component